MVTAFEVAQWLNDRLKPRDDLIVIGAKVDERVETDAARGQEPIVEEVELGLGWALAGRDQSTRPKI
jgi:hypothetical protein